MKKLVLILSLIVSPLVAEPKAGSKEKTYQKLESLTKILSYIENNYIESSDMEQLLDAAIKGMVSVLDPHSSYLPADTYRSFQEGTTGRYFGVGVEVSMKDNVLTVVAPLAGSPAADSDIRAGDHILKINGTDIAGKDLEEVVQMIKGPEHSAVTFLIKRPELKDTFSVRLKRKRIAIKSVTSKLLDEAFGYIQIKAFQEKTARELKSHLQALNRELNRNTSGQTLKGLILDMRNNPGGLLEEAIRVSDLFLKEGKIVSTRGRGEHFRDTAMAQNDGDEPSYPMITLVNGGSASAAEIVAGALQDHKRAVVLGLPTFGKGSVQSLIDLKDGSALKLTIARYYTPLGTSIQARGIVPDIRVSHLKAPDDAKAVRERDLNGHIEEGDRAKGQAQRDGIEAKKVKGLEEEDLQLISALDYLKSWYIFGGSSQPLAHTAPAPKK